MNTPAVDAILNAAIADFEPDDVPDILDHLTRDGGPLDYFEAIDDDEGSLAAELQEALQENPHEIWTALLADDFDEVVAEAADLDDDAEDAADLPREEYLDALDALSERALEDNARLDPDALAPFVVAADGDLDAAYNAYLDWFRNGAEPDHREAFERAAAGDTELAAAAQQAHREYATEARRELRADRLEDAGALKADRIKSRPAGSDDLGINDAVAELHGSMQASKELREADAPARRSARDLDEALAEL